MTSRAAGFFLGGTAPPATQQVGVENEGFNLNQLMTTLLSGQNQPTAADAPTMLAKGPQTRQQKIAEMEAIVDQYAGQFPEDQKQAVKQSLFSTLFQTLGAVKDDIQRPFKSLQAQQKLQATKGAKYVNTMQSLKEGVVP